MNICQTFMSGEIKNKYKIEKEKIFFANRIVSFLLSTFNNLYVKKI